MSMQKFTLEKYKAFPYVAWSIVICFSFFVFHLTESLLATTNNLAEQNAMLEAQVKLPIESIDFNHPTGSKHSL